MGIGLGRAWLRAALLGIGLVLAGGCAQDEPLGPSTDTRSTAGTEAAVTHAGILFSSFALEASQLNATHNGLVKSASPSMSAAELRRYGTALLGQSYVCAFSMWRYSDSYYNRADVKVVMADLSALAKSHAKTSCRQ